MSRRPPATKRLNMWLRDRVARPAAEHQWSIVFILWAVSFAAGIAGFAYIHRQAHEAVWPPQLAYQTLQLFTFKGGEKFGQVPWYMELARWLAPAVAAFVAGKGLVALFYSELQPLRSRLLSGHTIVCGLSDKGRAIAESFLGCGDVVVIDRDSSRSKLASMRSHGAIVLNADASSPSVLASAGVKKARYLITACDDSTNASIVMHARQLRTDAARRMDCLAHVDDLALTSHLYDLADSLHQPDRFSVRFFNIHEAGARVLLSEHPAFTLLPGERPETPRLAISGGGAMALAVLRELAFRWAVRSAASGEPPLEVLPVGQEAAQAVAKAVEHPSVDARFLRALPGVVLGEFAEPPAEDASALANVTHAYVLDETDTAAFNRTVNLVPLLAPDGRLVVCMRHDEGLATLIDSSGESDRPSWAGRSVTVFPLYRATCSSPDLLLRAQVEAVAIRLHERYRQQNPDRHAPAWDELNESHRDASRAQAEWIALELQQAGIVAEPLAPRSCSTVELTDDEVERLSELEHSRWMAERIFDGWAPGPTTDPSRKVHAYLVPWRDLDEPVRQIDRDFVSFWPELLTGPDVGFSLHRASGSTRG